MTKMERLVENRQRAAYLRAAMSSRRDIALRIAIGVITADLVTVKFVTDSVDKVHHVWQLGWVLRLMSLGLFIALVGVLTQIEIRNRGNRIEYQALEKDPTGDTPAGTESTWDTVRNSWASTWSTLAVFFLTAGIWWWATLLKPSH